MTIETTGIDGRNMNITLASQDISGQSNKVSLEVAKEIHDVTPFGVSWGLKAGTGLKTYSGSIDGFYNEESNEATEEFWDAITGTASVALVVAPGGGDTGDWTFTGSVHFSDVSIEASPDGGFITVSASFEGTGELVKGAAA